MSDLRSEMVNKVLNQWENVAMHTSNKPVVEHKVTFGERIFEYVKAHPYSSVDEVERGLGVDKTASVSSYLKTLLDKGVLAREEKLRSPYPGHGSRHFFAYYHISDTYNIPKKPRKPREVKLKPTVIDRPVERHIERIKQVVDTFNPERFVQDLSLKDAKAVYEVLKGYFSG